MKKWSLIISLLALAAGACDDTSTSGDGGTGGGDGGGTGIDVPDAADPGPRYPECFADDVGTELGPVGAQWTADAPWNASDVAACMDKCPDGSFTCFSDMCERGEDFVDCYLGDIAYCAGDAESRTCEEDYRLFGCCMIDSKCTEANTQDLFDSCLMENCTEDLQSFFDCAQNTCGEDAIVKCAGGEDVEDDGGVGDGGTGSNKSRRAFNVRGSLLRQLGQVWQRRYEALKAMEH
jgi:hypothetical protein